MKLKKGDKVYFTKESAPNFNEKYLTYGKKYEVLDIDGGLYVIEDDNGKTTQTNICSIGHLNGGKWLKVKTKKRKLEKEIENLQRKLETTEQLLKVSRERIAEIEKENSTFENIIFKEIEKNLPMSFFELGDLEGYFIESDSNLKDAKFQSCDKRNINVWKSEELAKASLALNQLIWLRDEWNEGWVADKEKREYIFCITLTDEGINVIGWNNYKFVLSFKDYETALKFAKQFESLINEAKPLL